MIVDEAHTCADASAGRGGRHQRYQLVRKLAADENRNLILVTATPHSGKEDAFRELLSFLDPSFRDLPRVHRTSSASAQLARHFVQRRRGDIEALPRRHAVPRARGLEATYDLSPEYRKLFERSARLRARDDPGPGRGSTAPARPLVGCARPAARARLESARSGRDPPQPRSRLPRRAVRRGDRGARPPHRPRPDRRRERRGMRRRARRRTEDDDGRAQPPSSTRRRLRDLAHEADALSGADAKLARGIGARQDLLRHGHNPIVFCRFIATADYVADALREDLLGQPTSANSVKSPWNPSPGFFHPRSARARPGALADKPRACSSRPTACRRASTCRRLRRGRPLRPRLEPDPARAARRARRPLRAAKTDRRRGDALRPRQPDRRARPRRASAQARADPDRTRLLRPCPCRLERGPRSDPRGMLLKRPKDEDAESSSSSSRTWSSRRKTSCTTSGSEPRKPRSSPGAASHNGRSRSTRSPRSSRLRATPSGSSADVKRFTTEALAPPWRGSQGQRRHRRGPPGRPAAFIEATNLPPRFDDETTVPSEVRGAGRREDAAPRPDAPGRRGPGFAGSSTPRSTRSADSAARRCGAIRTSAVSARTTLLVIRIRYDLTSAAAGGQQIAEEARFVAFRGSAAARRVARRGGGAEAACGVPSANVAPRAAAAVVAAGAGRHSPSSSASSRRDSRGSRAQASCGTRTSVFAPPASWPASRGRVRGSRSTCSGSTSSFRT